MAVPALLRCSQALPRRASAVLVRARAAAPASAVLRKAYGNPWASHSDALVAGPLPCSPLAPVALHSPHCSLPGTLTGAPGAYLIAAPAHLRPLPPGHLSGGVPRGYLRLTRRAPVTTLAAAPSSPSGRGFSPLPSSSRGPKGRQGHQGQQGGAPEGRSQKGGRDEAGGRQAGGGVAATEGPPRRGGGGGAGVSRSKGGSPRGGRVNEDDAIAELLGYHHGSSAPSRRSTATGSGAGVPISEDETAASAAALSALLQGRRPGATSQALGSLVKALVEEQSKMPWDVEEETRVQQEAAETAYEVLRQRKRRQAVRRRGAAKLSRVEQAMEAMSAEEAALQSLLREQDAALGGRAAEEVLRHVPADLEYELFEEWAKGKLARAPPGEKGLLMVSGLSHMRKQLKRSGGTGVPSMHRGSTGVPSAYQGGAPSRQLSQGQKQLAAPAQQLADKGRQLAGEAQQLAGRSGRALASAGQGPVGREGTGEAAVYQEAPGGPQPQGQLAPEGQLALGPGQGSGAHHWRGRKVGIPGSKGKHVRQKGEGLGQGGGMGWGTAPGSGEAFSLPWSAPVDSSGQKSNRGEPARAQGVQASWGLEGLMGGGGRRGAGAMGEGVKEEEVEVVGGAGGTRVTVAGAGGFTAQEWLTRAPEDTFPFAAGAPGLGAPARSTRALGTPALGRRAVSTPAGATSARDAAAARPPTFHRSLGTSAGRGPGSVTSVNGSTLGTGGDHFTPASDPTAPRGTSTSATGVAADFTTSTEVDIDTSARREEGTPTRKPTAGTATDSGVSARANSVDVNSSEEEELTSIPKSVLTSVPTAARGISSSAPVGARGGGGPERGEYRWQSRGPLKGVTWQGSSLYPGLPLPRKAMRSGALGPQQGAQGQGGSRGRGAQGAGAQGLGTQGPGAEEEGEEGEGLSGASVLSASGAPGTPHPVLPAPEVLTGPLARAPQRPQMLKARRGRGRGKAYRGGGTGVEGEREGEGGGDVLPDFLEGPAGTVILVDKPKTWTSFAVCARLRSLLKIKKVGHAGTLDPMATGLLVVCLGKATKFADSYQAMTKVYSGVMKLGELTPSLDADTEVSETREWRHISDEMLAQAAGSFLGDQLQVPPMYSAIKVKGEKMYDKARRGESLELPPRPVKIYDLRLWRQPAAHSLAPQGAATGREGAVQGVGAGVSEVVDPGVSRSTSIGASEGGKEGGREEGSEEGTEGGQYVNFHVTCSKGTYVRSLCRDLAEAVGTVGHLTALRREAIGSLLVDDAFTVEDITEMARERKARLDVQVGDMVSTVRSNVR